MPHLYHLSELESSLHEDMKSWNFDSLRKRARYMKRVDNIVHF